MRGKRIIFILIFFHFFLSINIFCPSLQNLLKLSVRHVDREQECDVLSFKGNIELGWYLYAFRIVLRCRQLARERFAKLRSDVLVKLELLDNKHG